MAIMLLRSSRYVAGGTQHDLLPSTGGIANATTQKPCEDSHITLEGGDKVIIYTKNDECRYLHLSFTLQMAGCLSTCLHVVYIVSNLNSQPLYQFSQLVWRKFVYPTGRFCEF